MPPNRQNESVQAFHFCVSGSVSQPWELGSQSPHLSKTTAFLPILENWGISILPQCSTLCEPMLDILVGRELGHMDLGYVQWRKYSSQKEDILKITWDSVALMLGRMKNTCNTEHKVTLPLRVSVLCLNNGDNNTHFKELELNNAIHAKALNLVNTMNANWICMCSTDYCRHTHSETQRRQDGRQRDRR